MNKNEVQNSHFWAGDVKPAFFNFAPPASPNESDVFGPSWGHLKGLKINKTLVTRARHVRLSQFFFHRIEGTKLHK